MNEELKIKLGVNEWLKLIKEDKNLNGAFISICQYIYLTEKENKKQQEIIDKTKNTILDSCLYVDEEYLSKDKIKLYIYLLDELLEILEDKEM